MQLRNTLIFIPLGETEVIKVQIFTEDNVEEPGYWNIDNNNILLSQMLYSEFRNCKTQSEQKKFFAQLKKISQQLI